MGSIILFILIVSWICVGYAKKQAPKEGGPGSDGKRAPGKAGSIRQPPGNVNYSQSRPGNVNYSQSRPGNANYSQSRSGNTGYGQPFPESAAARQQMLKSRLQQKYGGRPLSAYSAQSMHKNNKSAENILERAKNNVKENEKDELRIKTERNRAAAADFEDLRSASAGAFEEERKTFPAGYQNGGLSGLMPEESELIRQINDLMVTGYSGELTFERDFIAEGIEMLNRFEIPNG